MLTVDVIIPTYRPGKRLLRLLDLLSRQSVLPGHIILMNTEEKYLKELYDEKELVMKFPRLKIRHLDKKQFDHGQTRNDGVTLSDTQAFLLMTQDALPKDTELIAKTSVDCLERLLNGEKVDNIIDLPVTFIEGGSTLPLTEEK